MARPSNSFDSVSMTIAVTPQMKTYLEELTLNGMYGSSPSDAVRMLLSQAIEQKIKEGVLERRRFIIHKGEVLPADAAASSANSTS